MKYLGKRKDRFRMPKQVGTDPELGAIIRKRADRIGRSLEKQILHLIETGVDHDPEFVGNAQRSREVHETAQSGTFTFAEQEAKHVGAPPRTSRHAAAQKEKVG